MELTVTLLIGVAVLSLACEYMDASLGMGYGTTLTPLLLIMGLSPLVVVPAVLFGQIIGGLSGGLAHYRLGNVQLQFMGNSLTTDGKIVVLLSSLGIVGAICAVFVSVSISPFALGLYIGIMVLVIGVVMLWQRNKERSMSWSGMAAVAVVSAFNKGISGGGYGPLVTGGQVINGRGVKSAVGSTTIAEVFVCVVAFITYLILSNEMAWSLAVAGACGAVVAGPSAAWTVSKIKAKHLKLAIGIVTVVLGIVTIIKVV